MLSKMTSTLTLAAPSFQQQIAISDARVKNYRGLRLGVGGLTLLDQWLTLLEKCQNKAGGRFWTLPDVQTSFTINSMNNMKIGPPGKSA